jgi:DNA-directed RNA polymerase II subunit RPB1
MATMATMATMAATKPTASKIVGIQFSILSPEEIRKGAVTEITSRDTYIGNKPVLGGLFCPYMGVSEPGMLCPTDGLDYMQTPGYFGRIELAMPVFYYQHLNTIHKILRCVCLKCSRLLINKGVHKQALKMSPDERWSYVFGVASKVKRCGDENEEGCGCLMPKKIKKENLATLIAEWDSDGIKGMSEEDAKKMNMQLTPDIVLKVFRRISDDDVSFMGFSPTFSRPDWMICQVLAVPPPAVRPSIKMDGHQRSEDDLTHIIVNIVKANKTLQEKIRDGAQASVWHMVLQYYCATLVDNNIPGAAPVAQRSGRKLKSIKERLNGKGGRVRGNLMGKRVDFSARSVITPDPNLSIKELGVPLKIAKNITKPVVVNDMNRRFLTKLVRNGPEEYPGAKILERKGGENISLRYADRENIVLYNGDIVHRHMMDGDGVLFNRQPTLHRMSMMCHIARIMRQGDTFRMNVGDTKPYNADFDGDEMNMHMPQDEEAEAELKNLAAVPYQIISPAKNQSIIGIFQDSLLGSYRLTRSGVSFTPREAMNLLMAYGGVNEGLFASHAERITSFQILSQIMPAFTMKYKTKGFGENDDFATSPGVLEIVDGKYLRGQLDKDVLGGGSNGLITRTCNDFGNMAAAAFIDDLQNIVTEYMKGSAYSVGISDLIADHATNEQITQSITSKKKEVKNLIDQTYLGIFENATGNTNEDEFEFQVTNILNKATNDSGKIGLKSLSKDNRFVTMVKAGSKGSDLNISQMIACLGQQLIDGKRIPYGFENRTLPHFTKYDDSPGARGFVENSFISGLTPEELFFHAMGGRVGLIDTAVKTSSTGYIQRRLIKGMEDLKIEYDMTVRNNKGRVVQFSYGEDGIDPVKVESQIVPLVNLGLDEIYAHYHMPSSDPKDVVFTAAFTKGVISRMKKQKAENDAKCKQWIDFMIEQREKVIQRVFRNKNTDRVFLPVAFAHTINNVKGLQQISNNSIVDITPLEAFAMIEAAYKRLETMHYCAPTQLFKVMFFYYLSPKDLLMVKRFNKKALTVLLEMIVLKYKNSLIAPGEMVGMISAQSIGEPTTQLTLNSVSYDTRVMLRIDGQIKVHQIGAYIDQYIEKAERMEDHPNDTKLGYINADEDVFVPSVDAWGITSWKRVEAVTRHPVVNVDGTNTVLRVTTEDGRQVIATKAKSFLSIDAKNQLAATNGSDLKVGDYIPINQRAFEMPENDSTSEYLVQHAARYSSLKNVSEVNDVIPTFVHNGKVHTNMNRKKLAAIIGTNPFPDVRFDKIVSIEEIPNPTEWMYDFTVEETRTFIVENGMALFDTFHTAGSGVAMKANVTRGVPRIEELLSITENPKNSSLTICLKKDEETDCERAKELIAQIELTQLSELVESVSICFDPDDLNTLIQEDRSTMLQYYEYQRMLNECAGIPEAESEDDPAARSKWIIRMVMSREAMLDKRITMDDVHFAIKNSHGDDVSCIYADYNADKLVFRLRMNNINGKKPLKPKENPLDQSDKIYLLKAFQDQLLNNIVLRGLKNISKVTLRKLMDTLHKEDGAYVKRDTWVLDTKGTNLMDVLALDYIDVKRTISDDIQEIRSVLGIEAAREALLTEMTGVFENDGTYINYHHLSLLCDRMTASAGMVSIFRHGINNDNIGPIAKASFEETPEMFLKAARHAELDQMRGISANVMCGQEGYYGTSSFQVMLDLPQMIAKMEDVAFQAKNEQAEIAEAMGAAAMDTSACAFDNLTIESNVGSIQKVDLGQGADNYNVGF